MNSLFSSFDLYFFSAGKVGLAVLFWFTLSHLSVLNLFSTALQKVHIPMELFFLSLKPSSFNKFFSSICFYLMVGLLMINLIGVWPYNFALTSQMSTILFISVILWGSIVLFPILQNPKGFFSHLIPEGTPIYLTWFLFMIEIISNVIRPLTLTVRLVANILAGHLLMILLFKLVLVISASFGVYIILNMVEVFVAMIQAYIFLTMTCLYYSET